MAAAKANVSPEVLGDLEKVKLVKDLTWPEDNCCRMYKRDEFKYEVSDDGTHDYKDYCVRINEFEPNYHDNIAEYVLETEMNNNMESWKCGKNVAAKWCDTKASFEDGSCSLKGKGESVHGWAESQDTGMENQASFLIMQAYKQEELTLGALATVFSETNCHGDSSMVNGQVFDTQTMLTTGTQIKSIMFSRCDECESNLYRAEFFRNSDLEEGWESWKTMSLLMEDLEVPLSERNRCWNLDKDE